MGLGTSPPSNLTKHNFTEIDCKRPVLVQNPALEITRNASEEYLLGVPINTQVEDAWEIQ